MSYSQISDYKKRYFEYKQLSKIIGRPRIDNILAVYKQLKRNVQRVPTTLGSGQHGYLALVIALMVYATIPGATAFVRPADPGPFVLVQNHTPPATRANPALLLLLLPLNKLLPNVLIGRKVVGVSKKFKLLNLHFGTN